MNTSTFSRILPRFTPSGRPASGSARSVRRRLAVVCSGLFVCLLLGLAPGARAQLTYCNQCVSKDIKVQKVYLTDPNGNPLPACATGTPLTAKLCVDLDVESQTRYGIYLGFKLTTGGTTTTLSQCNAIEYGQGKHTLCYNISYKCGDPITIDELLLAWGNNQNDLNSICNANQTCNNYNPKCYSSNDPATFVVEGQPPLPVSLVYFRAQTSAEGTQLLWQTSMERDHDYFEVERSANARQFQQISGAIRQPVQVDANRKTYGFTDAERSETTTYYRLKQVDLDGSVNYSRILSVVRGDGSPVVVLSPNPVSDHLNVRVNSAATGTLDIEVFGLTGKRWASVSVEKTAAVHLQTLDTRTLPQGLYLVLVRLGDQHFIQKIVR